MKTKSLLLAHSAGMAMLLAGGGLNRIAAFPFGPRVAFEKPNEGKDADAVEITPEDIEAIEKKLTEIGKQVKSFGEEFVTKTKAGDKVTSDLKENVDKVLSEQGQLREVVDGLKKTADGLDARAKELEQIAAKRGKGGEKSVDEMTPGEQFISDERVKAALAQGGKFRGRVRIDVKAITSADMAGLVQPDRVQSIIALPERRLTVRDLITPGRTSQSAVQYWQETGFTNNADAVSEGTDKPTSTIAGELKTANVTTIAHIMIAAKQILDDSPALQSHIDGRLRYGLAYEEEVELLLGDGSGTQLLGIIPQATAYSEAFQPEMRQRIDYIRLALLQSELALFPASGIVLNPTDWARIELTKDAEGRYIFVMPQNETTPRLWGRPVVSTPAMTVTKFLVGAFKLGAQIFDREDANVEISTEDSDNFRKNLITLRAEERLALAVYRPEAFTYGTFQAST
jgi:HK97 family phage major capsid protein